MKRVLQFLINLAVMVGLCFTFFLLGCALVTPNQDRVFDPYSSNFAYDMKIDKTHLESVPINFQSQSGMTVGICYHGSTRIQIDPSYWYRQTTPLQKYSLIYHELGHCFCGVGHEDSAMKDGCPASLMYSGTINDSCLRKHWKLYTFDLKIRCEDVIKGIEKIGE